MRKHKLSTYLNIAACNIKKKSYTEAEAACNEALLLDPDSIKALYRRAKATALPINAGVPELRRSLVDLDRVVEIYIKQSTGNYDYVIKEKDRVQELIDVNYKREQDTYAKMFNPKSSVSEFVKRTAKGMDALKFKSYEEKEFEKELEEIDRAVAELIETKKSEFSFEIDPAMSVTEIPELEDVQVIVDKTIEGYRIYKKTGKLRDAMLMKEKIKETKYAKEHLRLVMNLDFTKPTAKMLDFADQNKINLRDPRIIEEFKKIQTQSLTDIQMMKEGKRPPSPEELQKKLNKERDDEFKRRMEEYEIKNKESDEKIK